MSTCSKSTKVLVKRKSVTCNRATIQKDSAVNLKMLFTDSAGNPTDPTAIAVTLENAGGGAIDPGLVAVKIDTGYWYVNYTPTTIGVWKDLWTVTLLGEAIAFVGSFEVIGGGVVAQPKCGLDFNNLIVIELDKTIADTSGNTLSKTEYLSFSTEYNPFYASVDMLRVEMGNWASLVPDDTIALAIHWSSMEADNITAIRPASDRYYYARSRFVIYDSAIKLFSMPMGASAGSGKQKQLGDLLIDNGSTLDYPMKDLIEELRAERNEWWRIVNAGGSIVNGQGLGPSTTKKGAALKVDSSRSWHDPMSEYYSQPTMNSQYKRARTGEQKHGYVTRNQYYYRGGGS